MIWFRNTLVASLLMGAASPSMSTEYPVTYHEDYRETPRYFGGMDYEVKGLSGRSLADHFLRSQKALFRLNPDDLRLVRVSRSLSATHYYYQQYVGFLEVEESEVVVSINNKTGKIFRIYNNYHYGLQDELNDQPTIGTRRALDISWQDLHVSGELRYMPQTKEYIVVDASGKARHVYETYLEVEEPFGAWEHIIDAYTGEVLSRRDTSLIRKRRSDRTIDDYAPVGPRRMLNMDAEMARLGKGMIDASHDPQILADGVGLVFDPDPRSVLMRDDINDDSPAEDFEAAYSEASLKDIRLRSGKYHLVGPWVRLVDFESPRVDPSVSETGRWDARRGDNAFNDVMTYFHIDQNQRYIQSLGFVGEYGIQMGSIEVDANGVSGNDNSYYLPGSNRMAFGHGCVDDNEDADVILHEYGHAINHSINPKWRGGDTGAMGEGFGDYWAGSYSISTVGGASHGYNKVFNWDGEPCWPGRKLDQMDARYDHRKFYSAHSRLEGFISDELWSTPLFQSLVELLHQGASRQQVDQIVLEAQFGLSSGLKMRDMAFAILGSASRLYPDGPHAAVFKKHFTHHNILEKAQ